MKYGPKAPNYSEPPYEADYAAEAATKWMEDQRKSPGLPSSRHAIGAATRRKEPSKGIVITDLGRQLLSQGGVTVKMKKDGCI